MNMNCATRSSGSSPSCAPSPPRPTSAPSNAARIFERGIRTREAEIRDLTEQRQRVAQAAEHPTAREDGAVFHHTRQRAIQRRPGDQDRSAALRALDARSEHLTSAAMVRLEALLDRDQPGVDARYLAAVADPAYERAFAKKLAMPDGASQQVEPDEGEAMLAVGRAMAERGMLAGTPTAGGFAVPLTVDPTINLTSDGALSPLRQVATVRSITSTELRVITSAGTTASFAAEAAEVGDGTPTLAGPIIKPERAHAFIPFSFEIGQDWPGLATELGKLLADAKDVLEADRYLFGTGNDEPAGLIATLDPSSRVELASANLAVGDVYGLQETLGARWQPRASWLSGLPVANTIHRFSGPASEEAPLFNDTRTTLLGKPWHEVSGLAAPQGGEADDHILVYGDLTAAFQIVDRIGMSVEVVPHLFGASRRPTGQRGLYAFWRTSSAVVVPEAVRVLVADLS